MVDIQELIEKILSGAKETGGKDLRSRVYTDEPILMTAAQMKTHTPPRYREMRKLAKGRIVSSLPDEELFYEQGRFMEDFEDDFEHRQEFKRYFPTYQVMNDQELRGYFSWRTKLRRGIVEKTSLSYAFVYIYELLNQIGVSSPLEGFFALDRFWNAYRKFEPQIDRYMRIWLRDYIVFHHLSRELLEPLVEVGGDCAVLTLMHYESHSAEEITAALNFFSSYNLEESRFYRQHPQDIRDVTASVFGALSAFYSKNHKYNFCEKLFGRAESSYYSMFRSAVFHNRRRHEDTVYEINEIHRYQCEKGHWICKRYAWNGRKNQQIGALLKNIDCLMRRKYGFKSPLKEAKTTKIILNVIENETEKFLEVRRKREAPKVEIDRSKLQEIRKTAQKIQSRLIVDDAELGMELELAIPEEIAGQDEGEPMTEEVSSPDSAEESANSGILNEIERQLLKCLLHGQAYEAVMQSKGLMLSVVIDSINDKLFDTFSDTVILWEGERPELIGDYINELKGIIGE